MEKEKYKNDDYEKWQAIFNWNTSLSDFSNSDMFPAGQRNQNQK